MFNSAICYTLQFVQECNLLHFEVTSKIFKIWITRKRLTSQKVLQTSSQNNTNHKSSFAFQRRLCLWRFCTAAMLHEKKLSLYYKTFHCSCHATWLPCKTFIQHYIKQMSECVHQQCGKHIRTTLLSPHVPLLCSYHILTSSTIYY